MDILHIYDSLNMYLSVAMNIYVRMCLHIFIFYVQFAIMLPEMTFFYLIFIYTALHSCFVFTLALYISVCKRCQ